ncbi:hypothetical protein EVAR_45021_1 [Eumeta japonica]|uniref:Uncharacterized protein n=1 Tax=Eumeta variegata TaxID=151549 RepID=A0A4C1XHK4_EUMVA|nr:hypothetical protein EVAR_45021_1 [Eumeta japonica]
MTSKAGIHFKEAEQKKYVILSYTGVTCALLGWLCRGVRRGAELRCCARLLLDDRGPVPMAVHMEEDFLQGHAVRGALADVSER